MSEPTIRDRIREPRRCGVCDKPLTRRQKLACCNAHRGILQQTVEHAQQNVRARLARGQFADPERTARNWAR